MERYEAKKLLKDMTVIYPKFKWNNETVDMWYEVLKPYTYQKARDSLVKIARDADYIPNVGTIARDIQKSPDIELINFNGRMYVIKVYTRNHEHEDSVFSFNYKTLDEAKIDLEWLKTHNSYDDIEQMWIKRELAKAPPNGVFRRTYERLKQEGAL